MMTPKKLQRSFGTHDETFHADEVTACALLALFDLIDEDRIFRTRDKDTIATCEYVCDVGGIFDASKKLFDHHQADYKGHLSSAGMVLQYLKDCEKITAGEFEMFNHSIIMGVDAHDNGLDLQPDGVCTYSHVIANFVPICHEVDAKAQDAQFFKAFKFAKEHLERALKRYQYMQSCKKSVQDAMDTYQECLIFNKGLPWLESFFELGGNEHPAKFLIMPSGKHWKLRGIPPSYEDRMKVRKPLPRKWAGLLMDELKKVSGIDGAIFCHKGRFISVWETKEDALKALKIANDN